MAVDNRLKFNVHRLMHGWCASVIYPFILAMSRVGLVVIIMILIFIIKQTSHIWVTNVVLQLDLCPLLRCVPSSVGKSQITKRLGYG